MKVKINKEGNVKIVLSREQAAKLKAVLNYTGQLVNEGRHDQSAESVSQSVWNGLDALEIDCNFGV